jgi:hypothetical protein
MDVRRGFVLAACVAVVVGVSGPAGAQGVPIHLKRVPLATGGEVTGLAYDGVHYYVALLYEHGHRYKCGRRCSETNWHGGVRVFDADGNYVRSLRDNTGPRFWSEALGAATDRDFVWTAMWRWGIPPSRLYKFNAGTGTVAHAPGLRESVGRLAHDGRVLWAWERFEDRLVRMEPSTMATTGAVSIDLPGTCPRDIAPDGLGGLWVGGTCAPAGTRRYALTETTPGTIEATLVESYDGFGGQYAQTTSTANPFEMVLLEPDPARPGRFVADHYLMPPYGPRDVLESVAISQAELAGCLGGTVTVSLAEPAPVVGGVTVTLASSSPHVEVSSPVRFAPGETVRAVPFSTVAVTDAEDVSIEASIAGHRRATTLRLRPIGPRSVSLAAAEVAGGTRVRGTLELECPAEPGEVTVRFSSSDPDAADPVAAVVTLPAGALVLPFEVVTGPVTKRTRALVTAEANGVSKSRALVVTPAP